LLADPLNEPELFLVFYLELRVALKEVSEAFNLVGA
jgi:hypothetical protein